MFRVKIVFTPLSSSARLATCNLNVLWQLGYQKLSYSVLVGNACPKISTPNRDVSANSSLARSNWMLTELSREGRIHEARKLFDEMCQRDVVTWTALISGYIKCQMLEEARRLFDRFDAKKNVITWTSMLGGYVKAKKIMEAERLFNEMPNKNVVSWNTMIDGYTRHGRTDSAFHLFRKMPVRNVVSWNTTINALAQCGRMKEAQRLFDSMPERDVISWTAIVAGLAKNGEVDKAREVFDRMPERNVVSWNAMITGYAQNSRLNEALGLFRVMPSRDLPSWNTMITGFVQNGELNRARTLFNEMPQKNVISWTTMITGYVQDGQNEEALKLFSAMQASDMVRPNEGTFVTVLGACSNSAGLCEGQQVHQIICKTIYQNRTCVASAITNMYSKCGELGMARQMFDDETASQRDVISWNGIIAAYAHHGYGREAISLFRKMQKVNLKPDDVTYVGLLSACSHAGLVDEGLEFFRELEKDTSITVREDHYACLVDLCGRSGRLKEAYDIVERLGAKSSPSILGALLAACNVHRDAEIGRLTANKLLEVEPENAGTYLLLSNIFASSGKWREAAKVRQEMKDNGLKKQPGCSWIELGNRVNVFVVGDKSHTQSNSIYNVLRDLHAKMKKHGCVGNCELFSDDDLTTTVLY